MYRWVWACFIDLSKQCYILYVTLGVGMGLSSILCFLAYIQVFDYKLRGNVYLKTPTPSFIDAVMLGTSKTKNST